jgi:hypothetical protein
MGPKSLSFRHNGDDAQLVALNVSQADTLQQDTFFADEMSDPLLFLVDFDTIDATENFLQAAAEEPLRLEAHSADVEELGQGLVFDETGDTAFSELNDAPSEASPPFLSGLESFSPPIMAVAHESPPTPASSTASAATTCPLRSPDDLAQSTGRMGRAVNRSAGKSMVGVAEGVVAGSQELVEPLAKRRRGNGKTNTVAA